MFVPAYCTVSMFAQAVIEIKSLTVILPIDPICFFVLILFFQLFSFFLFHFPVQMSSIWRHSKTSTNVCESCNYQNHYFDQYFDEKQMRVA